MAGGGAGADLVDQQAEQGRAGQPGDRGRGVQADGQGQAAAVPASQIFMLLGTLVLLPVILGYITFVYWLFRGKVRADIGYH